MKVLCISLACSLLAFAALAQENIATMTDNQLVAAALQFATQETGIVFPEDATPFASIEEVDVKAFTFKSVDGTKFITVNIYAQNRFAWDIVDVIPADDVRRAVDCLNCAALAAQTFDNR